MPDDGLYRAGRWSDVELYPPPSRALDLRHPQLDGERWEDAFGQFSTVKCSVSAEAAIGRVIARFRPAVDDRGQGILDAIKAFLSGPPDPGEPSLVEGIVPPSVHDDLYEIRVPKREGLVFIDLMSPETLEEIEKGPGRLVRAATNAEFPGENLAQHPDRRVTRLLTTLLYQSLAPNGVAGIRYPGNPDSHWEAFVVWAPPIVLPLSGEDVNLRWVAPWDEAFLAAVHTLGLRVP